MFNSKVSLLIGCLSLFWISPAIADSCQKSVVSSRDGYANVRSSAQIKKDNIIGTLPIGLSVESWSRQAGWSNIHNPFLGWIKSNQISTMSCGAATQLLMKDGLKAIDRFGKQAIAGNNTSAEIMVRMSQGLDGVVADSYLTQMADWATQNPAFLVSVLQRQSSSIRHSVLDNLNVGLGTEQSLQRNKFEKFLKTLPQGNIIVQEWKKFKTLR